MTFYVLEGPDGSGKSTLARSLGERGHVVKHFGPPKKGDDLFKLYTDAVLRSRRDTTFDRLHLGEWVYGEIVRGRSRLSLFQLRLIDRLIRARGGRVVICLPSEETLRASWERRRETEYVSSWDQMKKVILEYKALVRRNGYERFDFETEKFLLIGTRGWDRQDMLGDPSAKILLVGERISGDGPDLAFFAQAGCSYHLDVWLRTAGFQEKELALVNAYRPDGFPKDDLRELFYRFERVVFLGKKAAAVCPVSHGITVPHPQWVKRFYFYSAEFYIDVLRRIREKVYGRRKT